MKTTHLDLTGLKCPLPVLQTRKALRALSPGERIEIAATDPMSPVDIPNLVRETGDKLLAAERGNGQFLFRIEKAAPAGKS